MDLSVIIVSYNVRYFLEQCLFSVVRSMSGIEGEIIVSDNKSSDGTVEKLSPVFPDVRFLRNSVNLGFAAANNRALKEARGRYILFLNPDTIIPEDCLVNALRFFREHPDCGALGVRMIDGSGRFLPESKRNLPSAWSSFCKLSGIGKLFPRSAAFADYYANEIPEVGCGRVDVLSGAFFMAEKKLVDQLGGFDERFFMYGEDIDLSYRVTRAGYNNYYDGKNPVIHFKGESSDRNSARHIRDFFSAMSLFLKKHYHPIIALFMSGAVKLAEWMARFSLLFSFPKRQSGIHDRMMVYMAGTSSQFDDFRKLSVKTDMLIEPISFMDLEAAGDFLARSAETDQDKALLFCTDPIAMKDIVALISLHPGRMHYLFRLAGSEALVGSSSSDRQGIVISG